MRRQARVKRASTEEAVGGHGAGPSTAIQIELPEASYFSLIDVMIPRLVTSGTGQVAGSAGFPGGAPASPPNVILQVEH